MKAAQLLNQAEPIMLASAELGQIINQPAWEHSLRQLKKKKA